MNCIKPKLIINRPSNFNNFYDEGYIAGIFGSLTGEAISVKEVDCWCTGERTCLFEAKLV
ncbi:MAG: 4-vinyl reductase [Desulfobacterales bacterium]